MIQSLGCSLPYTHISQQLWTEKRQLKTKDILDGSRFCSKVTKKLTNPGILLIIRSRYPRLYSFCNLKILSLIVYQATRRSAVDSFGKPKLFIVSWNNILKSLKIKIEKRWDTLTSFMGITGLSSRSLFIWAILYGHVLWTI